MDVRRTGLYFGHCLESEPMSRCDLWLVIRHPLSYTFCNRLEALLSNDSGQARVERDDKRSAVTIVRTRGRITVTPKTFAPPWPSSGFIRTQVFYDRPDCIC